MLRRVVAVADKDFGREYGFQIPPILPDVRTSERKLVRRRLLGNERQEGVVRSVHAIVPAGRLLLIHVSTIGANTLPPPAVFM
jgi:hypothetical protein